MLDQRQLPPLKKLLVQRDSEGFSLVELVVVIAVLSILSSVAIPSFLCVTTRARASAALAAMKQIQKECIAKKSFQSAEVFQASNLQGYQIQSDGGNSCKGAQGTGVVSAIPDDTNTYPTFNLAYNTGELSYSFKGIIGTQFNECLASICSSNSSEVSQPFKNRLNNAISSGITLEEKYYSRGKSLYVIVEGDTWEEAQKNAKLLGGELATINDKEENEWLAKELYGDDKVSSKLNKKLALPGEELRGTALWLGHTSIKESGEYTSISGEKEIYTNWAPGELNDGIGKGESYTVFSLFDNYNRDPGMIMTVDNRQYNTPQLRERGGAHVFYGLAEIKLNADGS